MKNVVLKIFIILGLTASGVIWNGNFQSNGDGFIAKAEARRGRPATPVSYAGVARRSTVGAGAPGVGVTPGVGAGAAGVGVTPGVGAGAPGVGVAPGNAGGPVNRVGVRR